jgi:hypothetical protein
MSLWQRLIAKLGIGSSGVCGKKLIMASMLKGKILEETVFTGLPGLAVSHSLFGFRARLDVVIHL